MALPVGVSYCLEADCLYAFRSLGAKTLLRNFLIK